MAHKKGGGTTRNGRDSESKRLGVKVYGGQAINAGGIIIRQRGTKVHPGEKVPSPIIYFDEVSHVRGHKNRWQAV